LAEVCGKLWQKRQPMAPKWHRLTWGSALPSAPTLAIDKGMIRSLIIFLVASSAALAVEIPDTLVVDGQTYTGVVYQSHDASRLRVMHETGVGAFPIASLSAELQRALAYDPEAAKAAQEAERQALAAKAEAWAKRPEWADKELSEQLDKARQGNPQAAYWLGNYYATGRKWVQINWPEAERWYVAAVNLGHSTAAYKLAQHYERGRDLQSALLWYRKGAELRDARCYDKIKELEQGGLVAASASHGLPEPERREYKTFDSAAEREAWTTKVKLKELEASQRRADRAIDYVTGSEQERAAIRATGGITNRHGNRID